MRAHARDGVDTITITNCLQYFADSVHLLTEYQAGIRHGRSTEDQLLRLSQSISDGLQQSQMQRTVVAIIDYPMAYDKVWRDASLMKMSQKRQSKSHDAVDPSVAAQTTDLGDI